MGRQIPVNYDDNPNIAYQVYLLNCFYCICVRKILLFVMQIFLVFFYIFFAKELCIYKKKCFKVVSPAQILDVVLVVLIWIYGRLPSKLHRFLANLYSLEELLLDCLFINIDETQFVCTWMVSDKIVAKMTMFY